MNTFIKLPPCRAEALLARRRKLTDDGDALSARVGGYLEHMGAVWK